MAAAGWLGAVAGPHADNPGYDRLGYRLHPCGARRRSGTWEQGLPDWSLDRVDGVASRQASIDTLLRLGLEGPLELRPGVVPYDRLRSGD